MFYEQKGFSVDNKVDKTSGHVVKGQQYCDAMLQHATLKLVIFLLTAHSDMIKFSYTTAWYLPMLWIYYLQIGCICFYPFISTFNNVNCLQTMLLLALASLFVCLLKKIKNQTEEPQCTNSIVLRHRKKIQLYLVPLQSDDAGDSFLEEAILH